jgi:hypothetical protein
VVKANLILQNGTTVDIEGTSEEVAFLLEKCSHQKGKGHPGIARKDKSKSPIKRIKKGPRTPRLSGDLDLASGKKGQNLRDFFSQYEPSSNIERNLVFVYFLKQIREIEQVTIDHIFTCYRYIKDLKAPIQLQQSLIDTKIKKSWIDTASLDNIQLNISGINYLEHDMKKADNTNA